MLKVTIRNIFYENLPNLTPPLTPKDDVKIESSRPWYADEVKRRIEEHKNGKMETYPVDQATNWA